MSDWNSESGAKGSPGFCAMTPERSHVIQSITHCHGVLSEHEDGTALKGDESTALVHLSDSSANLSGSSRTSMLKGACYLPSSALPG